MLELDKTRKMEHDFVCPFLDCGKLVKRSCDLIIHFNVEVCFSLSRILDWVSAF